MVVNQIYQLIHYYLKIYKNYNIDLDNLPTVTNEFYNKLLDFNKSENPINETPQIKLNDNPKNKLNDILKCININRFEMGVPQPIY